MPNPASNRLLPIWCAGILYIPPMWLPIFARRPRARLPWKTPIPLCANFGQYWIFAHNGNLERFDPELSRFYQPVGSTDSERAFCYILSSLRQQSSREALSDAQIFKTLQRVTAEISTHGTFNYLLCNGQALFAHCSTDLYYIVRQAPFASAHLVDEDITVDFSTLTGPDDRVIVVATQPLTDNEQWTRLQETKVMMFKDGQVFASAGALCS